MSTADLTAEDLGRWRQTIKGSKHWVVKFGSNVLLDKTGRLDRPTFAGLVRGLVDLGDGGRQCTLVSSGAVALGRQLLGLEPEAQRHIPRLQALAAIGQPRLLNLYEAEFGHYQRHVAQLLFTRGDLDDRRRYLNARRAIEQVRALGALPIINENDTVATDELRFGDNDQLAAMTAGLVGADVLVILSDIDGIYNVDIDEKGERTLTTKIDIIRAADPLLDEIAGPSSSGVGTGGMVTKVLAARIAARFGIPTIIAPGKLSGVIGALAAGLEVGTLLIPEPGAALVGRKVWLGAAAVPVGALVCDTGAKRALLEQGASLLAVGIRGVRGVFGEGDVVELLDEDGARFGVGVTTYDSGAIEKIAGKSTEAISEVLGYRLLDCVVHRDVLVLEPGHCK